MGHSLLAKHGMLFSLVSVLMSRSGGVERAGVWFTRDLGISPGPGSVWLCVLRLRWLSSRHTELPLPASVSEAPHSPPAWGPLPFFWAHPLLGPMTSYPWGLWCSAAAHRAGVGDRRDPGLRKGEEIGSVGAVAASGPGHPGASSSPKA